MKKIFQKILLLALEVIVQPNVNTIHFPSYCAQSTTSFLNEFYLPIYRTSDNVSKLITRTRDTLPFNITHICTSQMWKRASLPSAFAFETQLNVLTCLLNKKSKLIFFSRILVATHALIFTLSSATPFFEMLFLFARLEKTFLFVSEFLGENWGFSTRHIYESQKSTPIRPTTRE